MARWRRPTGFRSGCRWRSQRWCWRGASEFLFIGIVAGGGSPFTAAAAGLLVNARHLPFGIAVKDLVGAGSVRLAGLSHHER
ncbi:AzlC protein [Pantoea agglomerans]|uniref:AzlC protein n=1 Tax=Enterobacter agglomerans TaxID=549 RepID=A0A379LRS3_ENTAG|nr:AzlC protein [Pantoea agglomerans]